MDADWITRFLDYSKIPKKDEAPSFSLKSPIKPLEEIVVPQISTESQQQYDLIIARRNEIDKELDKIYEKFNSDPESVRRYLDNPNNFSKISWEIYHKLRENYKNDLLSRFSQKDKKEMEEKEKRKLSKNVKGQKTIGSRKKWIPMR